MKQSKITKVKEQLHQHSLMKMMSRSGKNTVTSHFEFFKASQKQKENESEAPVAKISTGIQDHVKKQQRLENKSTEGMVKTIELNFSKFKRPAVP